MAAKKKTAVSKKSAAKRAPVNELRWAIVEPGGLVTVWSPLATRPMLVESRCAGDVIVRVRITEVTK